MKFRCAIHTRRNPSNNLLFFRVGNTRKLRIEGKAGKLQHSVMEMVIKCPACQLDLTVEDTAAGSQLKCPTCNTLLVVPAVAEASKEAEPQSMSGASDEQLAAKLAGAYRSMANEVGKAIVGQNDVIEAC